MSQKYMNRKPREGICEECNKNFFYKQYGKDKQFFCGNSCAGKYKMRVYPHYRKILLDRSYEWLKRKSEECKKAVGPLAKNWRGGISSFHHKMRGTQNWKNWRKLVFERDNYKCLDCGRNQHLEPHHILPIRKKEYRVKLFDLRNGITLCRQCHQKTFWKEDELARTYFSLIPNQV